MNWLKSRFKEFGGSLFIRDPRYFQIVFLTSFLIYGIVALNWRADLLKYGVILGTAISTQIIGILVTGISWSSIRSALITSLGLCLLLQSAELWVLALASALAIGSKFLIRIRNKHLFNPANFGIIMSILITGRSWISPGQWGSDLVLLLFFSAAGCMILLKISRLETGITFFLAYFILIWTYNVWYLGWDINVVIHKLTNGSLLLFTFFMITDPMTIPNGKRARILWSSLIALMSFVGGAYMQVYTAPLWVLFLFTPFTVLFDKIWPSIKYEWQVQAEGLKPSQHVNP